MSFNTSILLAEAEDLYNKNLLQEALIKVNQIEDDNSLHYHYLQTKIFYSLNEFFLALHESEECLKLFNLKEDSSSSSSEEEEEKESIKNSTTFLSLYELIIDINLKMEDIELAESNYSLLQSTISNYNALDSLKKEEKEILNKIENLIKKSKENYEENSKKYPESFTYYRNYLKYLYKGGIYINGIKLKFNSSSDRYFINTKKLSKGDVLLLVPEELVITETKVKSSPLNKQILEKINTDELYLYSHALFSTFLLEEQKKGSLSDYYYYLKLLPQDLSNFPFFFTNNELSLIKGTNFLKFYELYREYIIDDYTMLCIRIRNYKNLFSLNDYTKSFLLVISRVFGIFDKEKKNNDVMVMVPFADMFNHCQGTNNCVWSFDYQNNVFTIKTKQDYDQVGKEIFLSYGTKWSYEFFLYYGFLFDNNENNEYPIQLNIDKKKYKIGNKIKHKIFCLKKKINDNATNNFFTFLRYLSDNYEYDDCKDYLEKKSEPFSLNNEVLVLNLIKDIFENEIKNYDTTIEQDNEILYNNKDKKLTINERNCILMRKAEKEIIMFYINLVKIGLDCLKIKKDEYENFIKDYSNENSNLNQYYNYLDELKNIII